MEHRNSARDACVCRQHTVAQAATSLRHVTLSELSNVRALLPQSARMPSHRKRLPPRARASAVPADLVTHLPGYGAVEQPQFAGYASVRGQTGENGADAADERLFYWFVGTEDYVRKPTILWTNGGPGSSSFWGFFLENGPYQIDAAGKKLTKRVHAWNNHANYMIFEHPLSVMLSVAEQKSDIPSSVEQGIAQLYQALLNFVALHPEIARNPIVLAGESYAGTYLPLLAKAILRGNHNGLPKLDLRVMVLCDAWVDPMVQMAQDTTWACAHGLISEAQKHWLDTTYSARLPEVNAAIAELCGLYMTNTAQTADPPFQPIYHYLNDEQVRAALHVPAHYPKLSKNWSQQIADNYQARVNDSYRHVVQELLDGKSAENERLLLLDGKKLKVQVVSGLNDAKDCNFLGTGAWLARLQGQAAYALQAAKPKQWKPDAKSVLGFVQDGGQLSWLKVMNAGHMAARDQPQLIHFILDSLQP
jgi:vitellogenic carboxypeptidase-like protein